MNSNKTEAEMRQAIQRKIADLEEKSALLKDYTWLLKVPKMAPSLPQMTIWTAYNPVLHCYHTSCFETCYCTFL